MVAKRGRKRKNDMYFGTEEEEAVVKFLESKHIAIVDTVKGVPITIKHKLGEKVVTSVSYKTPNIKTYGNKEKFIETTLDFIVTDIKNDSIDLIVNKTQKNVIIVIVNELERNLIFNEWLKAPLDKMIESIIRKYDLYSKTDTFEELHSDTVSFLMSKIDKFEPGRNKKAYSYFGTIVKHYALGRLIKEEKYTRTTASYEDVSDSLEEREDLSYVIDDEPFPMDKFIKKLTNGIKEEMDDNNHSPKKKLNENEVKVGDALIEILENWETAFESMKGGAKYNKNSVLETMRNYTNLSTKDIRLSMKRYKDLYDFLKYYGL